MQRGLSESGNYQQTMLVILPICWSDDLEYRTNFEARSSASLARKVFMASP